MVRNLSLYSEKGIKIDKKAVHNIVERIIDFLNLKVISLDINFVTEETIIYINKKYLNHNYATDIISFNYSFESYNLDGEILICNVIARENALKFHTTYEQEIRRLIIHGILHLIGYDDTTENQRKKMRAKENILLAKLNGIKRVIKK